MHEILLDNYRKCTEHILSTNWLVLICFIEQFDSKLSIHFQLVTIFQLSVPCKVLEDMQISVSKDAQLITLTKCRWIGWVHSFKAAIKCTR